MGLKLYGFSMSAPTESVMTCLAEKEIEYELVHLSFSAGEHKSPAHLAKNPFGLVPVLEDGSVTLFESRAISKYIAYKYKGTGTNLLRRDNIEEEAMVGVWLEVESQQFCPAIDAIAHQILINPFLGLPTDQSIIDANLIKLHLVLDIYEARLSNSKYLACDFFTLADLHHLPYIHYFMKTPYANLITSRAHVKAWWEDISARPSFIKATQQNNNTAD
ncbi:hypothetical protein MKW92_006900 [Papaver armeniacum]|nr:hypothetical protein MKW92_006900 [Papaver armeniacum]